VGDIARGDACDKFIEEFGPDIITRYRSVLLDQTFGEKVSYYIGVDDMSGAINLHAVVRSDVAEEFQIISAPSFYLTVEEDDLVQQVVNAFGLDEDEAQGRLLSAGLLPQRQANTKDANEEDVDG